MRLVVQPDEVRTMARGQPLLEGLFPTSSNYQ
jgi:hypothetical protein